MIYSITCPFCFGNIDPQGVHFRSVITTSKMAEDAILREFAKQIGDTQARTMQHIWYEINEANSAFVIRDAQGMPVKFKESESVETPIRLCPHCHNKLPADAGKYPQVMIAFSGASQSGKTVYMLALRDGARSLGKRIGWIGDAFMEDKGGYYQRMYLEMRDDGILPRPTQKNIILPPLAYTMSISAEDGRTEKYLVCFYDMAGELLHTPGDVAFGARALQHADGVIFMLDPTGLDDIQSDVRGANASNRHDDMLEKLHMIMQMSGAEEKRLPVAVTVTKGDAIQYEAQKRSAQGTPWVLGPDNIVFSHSGHGDGFSAAESVSVHRNCMNLLNADRDAAAIARYIEEHVNMRGFITSALGHMPEAGGSMEEKDVTDAIEPCRVMDPILWILAYKGMYPQKKVTAVHKPSFWERLGGRR